MEYEIKQLEQENSYLSTSKEDLEQVQLNSSIRSCSSKHLRDQLYNLEKLHDKCAADMKAKEAEWNIHIEKLKEDLKCCTSELDEKNRSVQEAYKELENSQFLLEVKNGEISVLTVVLKSEFDIAYSELFNAKKKLERKIKQFEDRNILLEQQLAIKNIELLEVTDKLRRHRVLLNDSDACKRSSNEDTGNTSDALEIAELAKRTIEVQKYELELLKQKADMDRLKLRLEESRQVHEQENAKLLLVLKEQNDRNTKLHKQVCDLEAFVAKKSGVAKTQIAEEMEGSSTRLCDELSHQKTEIAKKETENLDLSEADEGLELEIEEKDLKVRDLQSLFNECLKKATDHYMSQSEEMSRIISNLKSQFEKEWSFSESMVEELESQYQVLLTELKTELTDRDNLLLRLTSISDRIEMFSSDGTELMKMLKKMSGSQ